MRYLLSAVGVRKLSWTTTASCDSFQPSPSTSVNGSSVSESNPDGATMSLPAFSEEKERKATPTSSYYETMAPTLLASVLAVGRCDGRIELVAAGMLPLLVVDLKSLTGEYAYCTARRGGIVLN